MTRQINQARVCFQKNRSRRPTGPTAPKTRSELDFEVRADVALVPFASIPVSCHASHCVWFVALAYVCRPRTESMSKKPAPAPAPPLGVLPTTLIPPPGLAAASVSVMGSRDFTQSASRPLAWLAQLFDDKPAPPVRPRRARSPPPPSRDLVLASHPCIASTCCVVLVDNICKSSHGMWYSCACLIFLTSLDRVRPPSKKQLRLRRPWRL